jgi:hypothetical protein
MKYSIMMLTILGNNSVYVSISENGECINFNTFEDAQDKLTELQKNNTGGIYYKIVSYPSNEV